MEDMENQNEILRINSELPGSMLSHAGFNNTTVTKENRSVEPADGVISKVKNELSNRKMNFLIEEIKKIVIDMVYYSEDQIKINFSDYLTDKLGFHYTYMANLFSKVHGTTIQNFIITTKIERVKELLIYEGLTLTEISFMLHYSSVAHLSNQFKKIEGISPSQFMISKGKRSRLNSNKFSKVSYTYTKQSESNPVILSLVPAETPKHYEGGSLQMGG
jgi:AraC-like DNA-binding protein